MVDIVAQKRLRGATVRPATHIPDNVWFDFKIFYPNKNIRDSVISKLLQRQMEDEIVVVEYNIC